MQEGSASREFPVKDSHFVIEWARGEVLELSKYGKTQQLLFAAEDEELEIDVPWHAEVEEGDRVYAVFGYDTSDPNQKIAYYLFNESNGTLEEKRQVAKPNKGPGIALLDFALVILLGITMSPVIADIMQNKPGRSLIAIFSLIFLLYLMVHKLTYTLLMKEQIQQIEAINRYIMQLSQEPETTAAE